ncbi:MFS transporter [Pseudolysinimonas sp.]|uniref:MFS transporter n=1 Tax=Pseudolysinimonas sp. TaxID=2680009 RepID=UPI003F7DE368
MNSRRAWLVFGIGVFAYLVAVTQRSTFGVAGVEATQRFATTAAALSTVAVVQTAVYGLLQVPVGVLLDRFGSRRILAIGAALMALGQLVVAFSPVVGVAVVGRVLVGCGDAFTFLSVIRLLPGWFTPRLLPQLLQWVGMLGSLGQIVSALPFALLLRETSWQVAFLSAVALSVLSTVLVLLLVRPGEPLPLTTPIPVGGRPAILRSALARPGTQLGFWAHMMLGALPNLLGVLWGYPFLTQAIGLPIGLAAAVMGLFVAASVVGGPTIGWIVARFPMRRSNLVLGVGALSYGFLALLLLWPGIPPLWFVMLAFLGIGVAGPGSMVGLDFARTFNPSHAGGSASGIANSGGFIGAFVGMFAIGLLLDARAGHDAPVAVLYSYDAFRVAFLAPFGVALVALVGLLVARRRTRARMFLEDGIIIAPFWVALFRRVRGGRRRPNRGGDGGMPSQPVR